MPSNSLIQQAITYAIKGLGIIILRCKPVRLCDTLQETGGIAWWAPWTPTRKFTMAILIEGISIVIKVRRIVDSFKTWQGFVDWVPNHTLCSDNEIARIGFMSPTDVSRYISDLESRGIVYLRNRQSQDIAVIDQLRGLCCDCNWIEAGTMPLDGDESTQVMAARLVGSKCERLMCPDGWKYEGSLTRNHRFIPTAEIEKGISNVDESGKLKIFTDNNGKQWFMGRPNPPKSK